MKKEHIDIYYDHYKDTFEKVIIEKSNRQKYFYIMLFLVLIISLTIAVPDIISGLTNDIIKKNTDSQSILDFAWIKSLFIFSFIWVSFAYYQSTLNIERLYHYLHLVESNLSRRLGNCSI